VDGDATRLAQALQNLLTNAARYTPPQGEIRVEAGIDRDTVFISVIDNGMGVPAEAQHRIFGLFVQEHVGQMAGDGGLGIGLALARTLVEQHEGTVSVRSEGAGRGSTFTLRLPLLQSSPKPEVAPDEPAERHVAAMRVLVVDDNQDSADTMAELLRLMGHRVHAAYGAQSAVHEAAAFKPELMLLDLSMPDGDGFSVMKQVRARTLQPVYIVAMTGYGQQSDLDKTLAAGFDQHLTKPVGPEALQQVLDETIRMRT
jgi:CheY-like chemotaxis protein/anti-sigma regulatory factor (Ser/Thr protein kinase)